MSDLKKYLNETSKYVSLKNGDSYVGVLQSWKVEKSDKFKNQDGSGKEMFVFAFEDGKTLSTTSRTTAASFALYPMGTKVRVVKTGEGTNTKYIVTKE